MQAITIVTLQLLSGEETYDSGGTYVSVPLHYIMPYYSLDQPCMTHVPILQMRKQRFRGIPQQDMSPRFKIMFYLIPLHSTTSPSPLLNSWWSMSSPPESLWSSSQQYPLTFIIITEPTQHNTGFSINPYLQIYRLTILVSLLLEENHQFLMKSTAFWPH